MMYKAPIKRMTLLFVIWAACLNVNATTYSFIGNSSEADPTNYNTPGNWENNNNPGLTIIEGDTVYINSNCVIPYMSGSNDHLEINGVFELGSDVRLIASTINVSSTGHFKLLTGSTLVSNLNAEGMVSGSGELNQALICEGCSIYPGGIGDVGSLTIRSWYIDAQGEIIIDIDGAEGIDTIIGNGLNMNGEILVNFIHGISQVTNCQSYYFINMRLPFSEKRIKGVRCISHADVDGRVKSRRLEVFINPGNDRALHFDGVDDYVSPSADIGLVRTIEFPALLLIKKGVQIRVVGN